MGAKHSKSKRNNKSKNSKKSKSRKYEKAVEKPPDIASSSSAGGEVPLIESVSTQLIAEISDSYNLKENGGFKRAFFCVNSSLV